MPHSAILENAKRLISDAKHLFDAERVRSAMALAILAAEEIGKIGILGLNDEERAASVAETGQSFERQLSSHWCKLNSFLSMCQIQMMDKVERIALKARNLPDTREGRVQLRRIAADAIGRSAELKEWMARMEAEGFGPEFQCNFTNAYLLVFGGEDGFGDVTGQIGTGIANRLKQFGFYVDSGMTGSPSGEDEREDARRWIAAVSGILESDVVKAVMAGIERQQA